MLHPNSWKTNKLGRNITYTYLETYSLSFARQVFLNQTMQSSRQVNGQKGHSYSVRRPFIDGPFSIRELNPCYVERDLVRSWNMGSRTG